MTPDVAAPDSRNRAPITDAPLGAGRWTQIQTLEDLQRAVAPERAALVQHPLYGRCAELEDLRRFMEHHVFAVWDFMSLLKSLQRELTCVEVPWVPRGDRTARRLLNEIVLGEESDEVGGDYASHFELYLASMRECGADTSRIDAFITRITRGEPVRDALAAAAAPEAARRFVAATFTAIESRALPRIAAAFTLGREDVIPDMFKRLIQDVSRRSGDRLGLFLDYLDRHVRLDGERHGPMSARLLQSLCGTDGELWREAALGAHEALRARRAFWDEIENEIARATPEVADARRTPRS